MKAAPDGFGLRGATYFINTTLSCDPLGSSLLAELSRTMGRHMLGKDKPGLIDQGMILRPGEWS